MQTIPDVSFYQYRFRDATLKEVTEFIDFRVMRGQSPAVIIRAGQNLWEDICFDISWKAAKEAGLQRGSYWFYDSRANPKRQAEKWVDVLGNDAGELELWMDFEEYYHGDYQGMKNWYDFAERLKALLPHKQLGVYTGYYYWTDNIKSFDHTYFSQYPLWIAAYSTTAPRIPKTWTDWLMWQYTDSGKGSQYGVKSADIDLNYRVGEIVGNSPTPAKLLANFDGAQVEYEQG